jgi:hypothetical protein
MPVVAGCLWLLGIGLCTFCAHFQDNPAVLSLGLAAATIASRLRPGAGDNDAGEKSSYREPGAASYARYSSDLQTDRSNEDQQRKCRDRATSEDLSISIDLEFSDQAVSGAKHDRVGFEALMSAARSGRISVLYIENLSRLARDSVLTLQTLRELVYVHHVRIFCIDESIDTEVGDSWELLTAVLGIQNEQYLRSLAKFVFRGQEGLVLDNLCVGDYCFGYSSEPIPGSEAHRPGRNAKPLKQYIIDLEKAQWVTQIFYWFVEEKRSIRWITRELNRLEAPKDHRSTTKEWRHQQVSKLLANTKYVGKWPWGQSKNVRNPMTGKTHQEKRSPAETEKWVRHFPDLQVIDNETFEKAQARLRKNAAVYRGVRRPNGQLNGATSESCKGSARHLLSGIIQCGHCDRNLNVGGPHGKYLFCPGYKIGVCPCQTQLRRDLAEELILSEISKKILSHPEWLSQVLSETQAAFDQLQQQTPAEIETAENSLANVERRIEKLLDRCEIDDDPELSKRLVQRRSERDAIRLRLEQLSSDDSPRERPTEDWVGEQVGDLRTVLNNGGPAAALALRNLLDGQIMVREVRLPGKERHYLQGEFCIKLGDVAEAIGSSLADYSQGTFSERIVIDFRKPDRYEELADGIKCAFDEGLSVKEICLKFDCSYTLYTSAQNHWYESHGQERPDGRGCKKRLNRPGMADQLKDRVMELWNQDLQVHEIAAELDCCLETVRAAVVKWHDERGLPAPDGRARRREIRERKQRQKK